MRMLFKASSVLKCIIVFGFLCLNVTTTAQQDQSLEHWMSIVEKNPDDAAAWFNIGVLHETGQGTEKNQTQAHDAYQKAIALGYAPAMYNLGSIYARQKDYANARLWWEKAAELDLPEAQYNMGMLYEKGWGVNIDPQQSSNWYQRAAETAMEKYFQLYQKSRSEHPGSRVADESSLSMFNRLTFINAASAASLNADLAIEKTVVPAGIQLAQADTESNSSDQDGANDAGRPPGWNWVYSQSQEKFTIQLFATKDPSKTGKFIQQYALSEDAHVIQAVVKGTTYYKVLIGSFSEWNDAAVEIGTFPQDLRNQRPWVRKFGSLYNELPKAAAAMQNSQPEIKQALETQPNTGENAEADSVETAEHQSTALQPQTAAPGETASQDQAGIEQIPDVSEPVNTQADEETSAAEQVNENIASDHGKSVTDDPQMQAASDSQELEAQSAQPKSTQAETAGENKQASLELTQTDEIFTMYTQKQLASDELSAEFKARLTSGLEAIASGDHDSGYDLLSNLAESGLPEAQYRVSLLYSQGKGVDKDDVKAFELMKSASEQGHPYAQQSLADFYINGVGVDANSSLAAYWQQTAADNVKKLESR